MGSKGIKAIVLDPAGTPVIRKPKNAEAFKAANRAFAQELSSHPYAERDFHVPEPTFSSIS